MRLEDMGRIAAQQGTHVVEEGLQREIQEAPTRKGDVMFPEYFLQGASLEFWRQRQSLEPIFYLWGRYWNTRVPDTAEETPETAPYQFKLAFPSTVAKIVTNCEQEQREDVVAQSIQFIHICEPELEMRVQLLAHLAANLTLEGAPVEGKKLAKLVKKILPRGITLDQYEEELLEEATGGE